MDIITSVKNQKVKGVIALQESKYRKETGLCIVEGIREIKLAISSGYVVQSFIRCPELLSENIFEELFSGGLRQVEIIEVSKYIYEKLAYRENRDGLIAIIKTKALLLSEIKLSENPLILVIESVEKPGNLGAMLRTADAAKIDVVIVCDSQTDLFNPNIIRSSVGCIFSNQIVCCSTNDARIWLKENSVKVYSAALSDTAKNCYSVSYKKPSAIVMGSEAKGLSRQWLDESSEIIMIPMSGKIDSMNVSVSCAILIFEAVRQRKYL